MARDIEEFLRRAAERKKQGQARPAPEVAPPPRQQQLEKPTQRLADQSKIADEVDPYRELPRSREAGASKPAAPPVAPKSSGNLKSNPANKHESIAQHVREAIVTSDVTENALRLGKEVGLADEKLEARLAKFDHAIGGLEGMASIQQDRVETEGPDKSHLAVGLLELFKNPQTVRQSILISEILKRPNFDD
jgi:hypothetical protein